jgi:histidinol-phosphate phosphatase family protein
MQAVILAGGKGTRLAKALGMDIPKPMAPVLGVPLLQRTVESLRDQGIKDILILVHHRADVVRDHFGDGGKFGVSIRCLEEKTPRGTAGALLDALPYLEEEFLVVYGDTLVDLDFRHMLAFHKAKQADLTLFAHPNDHPQDSDLVEVDRDWRVTAVRPYPHPEGSEYRNLVNAALYVMRRDLLAGQWPEGAFDIAKHAVPRWLDENKRVFAYRGDGYIKDMGTPERLAKVEGDLKNGTVARKSGHTPRVAVFLDRDGTLNVEKGHLARPEDLELFPSVGPAIRSLNRAGIPAIIITNQPVIARGEADFEDIEAIHRRLENLLAQDGAFVDAIFYCPHHPDKGFAGERPELKISCNCRKPAAGLVDEACKMFSIDRAKSWFIGDSERDLECAKNAGVPSVLVRTGPSAGRVRCEAQPAFTAPDAPSAIAEILRRAGLAVSDSMLPAPNSPLK